MRIAFASMLYFVAVASLAACGSNSGEGDADLPSPERVAPKPEGDASSGPAADGSAIGPGSADGGDGGAQPDSAVDGSDGGGPGKPLLVFLTLSRFSGDLVGEAITRGAPIARATDAPGAAATMQQAADYLCRREVTAANVLGSFRAFIAVSAAANVMAKPAADRISGQGPWKLVNGMLAFPDRASLMTGPLVPINHTAYGTVETNFTGVWTGTMADGSPASLLSSCASFNGGLAPSATFPYRGAAGAASSTGTTAQFVVNRSCADQLHLYCFEEP